MAQEYSAACMAYLYPCPHRNHCWLCGVVGGTAQDTLRALVLVWDKKTPSVLMDSSPSMGSVLRDVVNRKRYVNILLINKAMPPG